METKEEKSLTIDGVLAVRPDLDWYRVTSTYLQCAVNGLPPMHK